MAKDNKSVEQGYKLGLFEYMTFGVLLAAAGTMFYKEYEKGTLEILSDRVESAGSFFTDLSLEEVSSVASSGARWAFQHLFPQVVTLFVAKSYYFDPALEEVEKNYNEKIETLREEMQALGEKLEALPDSSSFISKEEVDGFEYLLDSLIDCLKRYPGFVESIEARLEDFRAKKFGSMRLGDLENIIKSTRKLFTSYKLCVPCDKQDQELLFEVEQKIFKGLKDVVSTYRLNLYNFEDKSFCDIKNKRAEGRLAVYEKSFEEIVDFLGQLEKGVLKDEVQALLDRHLGCFYIAKAYFHFKEHGSFEKFEAFSDFKAFLLDEPQRGDYYFEQKDCKETRIRFLLEAAARVQTDEDENEYKADELLQVLDVHIQDSQQINEELASEAQNVIESLKAFLSDNGQSHSL